MGSSQTTSPASVSCIASPYSDSPAMSVASLIDASPGSITFPIPNNDQSPSRGALIILLHFTSVRTPKFLDDLCCSPEDQRFITNLLVFTIRDCIKFPMAYQYLTGYLRVQSATEIATPGQVFDFISNRFGVVGLCQRTCTDCMQRDEDRTVNSVIEHVQCPVVADSPDTLYTDLDVYNTYVDRRVVSFDCVACGSGTAFDKVSFYSPPPFIGISVTFSAAPCVFYLTGILERCIGDTTHRWVLFAEIWRNKEQYSLKIHLEPGPDMVHPTDRLIGTRVPDENLVLELLYYRVF